MSTSKEHAFTPGYYLRLPAALCSGLWLKWRAPRFGEASGARAGRIDLENNASAPLRLLALGDSVIAGVGIRDLRDAMAVQCAHALAKRLQRSVHWQLQGENGARAAQIRQSCPDLREFAPEIILISVGVNNVTSMQSPARWQAELGALIQHLHQQAPKARQIYLGVPPMAQFPLLSGALQRVMGERATCFDALMRQMLLALPYAMHVPVSLPPEENGFADDGYHPSSQSCRIFAGQLAETFACHRIGRDLEIKA